MPRSPHRPIVECPCCGVSGMMTGAGWIDQCYDRWVKADRPSSGPPARVSKEELARRRTGRTRESTEINIEEFLFILVNRAPISINKASDAIGVHRRTGTRYMKKLRERGLIE